MGESLGPEGKK